MLIKNKCGRLVTYQVVRLIDENFLLHFRGTNIEPNQMDTNLV